MPLDRDLPVWPGSPGVVAQRRMSIDSGDEANVTQLALDVHSGTHVDAPLHFVAAGKSVDEIGLHPFMGPVQVVHLPGVRRIDAVVLAGAEVAPECERLLLRTLNSESSRYRATPFQEDYAALTLDGAVWLAARGVKLVGIDYLSIQLYEDSADTHRALLSRGVCILEGLVLSAVPAGTYDLICLPLSLPGAEAAPARAVLISR